MAAKILRKETAGGLKQRCWAGCGQSLRQCRSVNNFWEARRAGIFVAWSSKQTKAPAERHRQGEKAVEGHRSPEPVGNSNAPTATRSVLECASPLALSDETANDAKYANGLNHDMLAAAALVVAQGIAGNIPN